LAFTPGYIFDHVAISSRCFLTEKSRIFISVEGRGRDVGTTNGDDYKKTSKTNYRCFKTKWSP